MMFSLKKSSAFVAMLALPLVGCYSDNLQESKERAMFYNSIIPKEVNLRERVLTTVCCKNAEEIPKHEHAGQIVSIEGTNYQLMHNGIKIIPDCYYGSWMTLLIQLLQGHHEPQEERAFYDVLQLLPEDAVMVELGAFWGYYSLWLKKEIPRAKTYLIEPDYKNLLIGKEHFSCNNFMGDFTHAMIGSSSLEKQPFIHILHSDIQGAEVEMLKGCKQLIEEKRIGYFFLSTHRGTHEKCLEAFEGTEYDILLSITREESFSADGLIIAKSPEMKEPAPFNLTRRTEEIRNFISEISHEKNID